MANLWYRTGTISVTNGSPNVVGSGTAFTGNINPGDLLLAPDGNLYEISTVPDNISFTIKQKNGTAAYLGSTVSGQSYAIVRTGPNNATVATQLTVLATNWQQDRDQYANWLGGTATGGDGAGNYPLTDAVGVVRNVACPAKIASLVAAMALINSPTFTGTPMITTTPAAGDNSHKIADTAFVQTAILNVISGAPGALDTLNELAAALGDDANYAATIVTALAGKSPLAGPGAAQPFGAGETTVAGLTVSGMVRQTNRITAVVTIPDGVNAVMIGPFEVSPDTTVTGAGNSTWSGLQ